MRIALITLIVIVAIFLIANILSDISGYLVKNYKIPGFYWIWLFIFPIVAISLIPLSVIPDFSFLQNSNGFVPLWIVNLTILGFYFAILVLLCIILYKYFSKPTAHP